jgi:glycosyltransferase involved in cell wall biosynthesis
VLGKLKTKKKSIAYVHTGVWPSKSPSFTFVTYNAMSMSEYFDSVYLIVKRGSFRESEQVLKDILNESQPDNLKVIAIYNVLRFTNLLFYITAIYEIFKIKDILSAVISRNTTFLPYMMWINRYLRIPVYYESHDFYTDLSLRNDNNTLIRKRNSRLENKDISQLTGLICLQNTQKDLYQRYYPLLNIHVLRTGLNKIYKNDTCDRKYICYIGSFDTHKGIEALIKAAYMSSSKPLILLIGGKTNKEISYVNEIAQRYDYQDKIKITGWIDKKSMSEYLSLVKVGVVSLTDTFFNHYITSPLKILDYYSYGIPIISTDLPTTRELIIENETGLFINAIDDFSFANHIDRLYNDSNQYNIMVNKVYEKAEEMLWDNRALNLKNIVLGNK